MIAITDASPLIYLAKIGLLELLPKLFEEVITTSDVKNEVLSEESPEKVTLMRAFRDWIKIRNVNNKSSIENMISYTIHIGEASILALAEEIAHKNKIIIIDDFAGRELARILNIEITGTIGIILRSVAQKHISKEKGVQFLRVLSSKTTFRISSKILFRALDDIEKI